MKKHIENAKKVLAILTGINKTLDALEIKHIKAQAEMDTEFKKAA